MELFVWFLIGIAATWRLTNDITSNLQLDGPFKLYVFIRRAFQAAPWEWVRDAIDCAYCVSFCAGFFVTALLPIYRGQSLPRALMTYFVVSLAVSGAVTYHYRRMKAMFGTDASES